MDNRIELTLMEVEKTFKNGLHQVETFIEIDKSICCIVFKGALSAKSLLYVASSFSDADFVKIKKHAESNFNATARYLIFSLVEISSGLEKEIWGDDIYFAQIHEGNPRAFTNLISIFLTFGEQGAPTFDEVKSQIEKIADSDDEYFEHKASTYIFN